MLSNGLWAMRYAWGWLVFHVESNEVVLEISRLCTRAWAYYWVLAAAIKYRTCWGNKERACRAKRIIDRAIQIRISEGRRLDKVSERRFWQRVAVLAEQGERPQWAVRDLLEDAPGLMDMPLDPQTGAQR